MNRQSVVSNGDQEIKRRRACYSREREKKLRKRKEDRHRDGENMS